MIIKKIPFGTDEGLLITDFSIKKKVLDYLYNSLNLSKHRFIMLNTIKKLEFLKESEHYVSPSFKGFNYFLIFMNIDNKKYCDHNRHYFLFCLNKDKGAKFSYLVKNKK